MTSVARIIYRFLAALFLAGVVLEFFLAGLGVFRTQIDATGTAPALNKSTFDHNFHPHLMLGDVLFFVSIILLIVAFVAHIGRGGVLMTAGLLVLLIVQATVAFKGPAEMRALHPVLGLLVLGVAVRISARRLSDRERSSNERPTIDYQSATG